MYPNLPLHSLSLRPHIIVTGWCRTYRRLPIPNLVHRLPRRGPAARVEMRPQLWVVITGAARALRIRQHAFEYACDDRRGDVVVEQAIDKVRLAVRQDRVRRWASHIESGGLALLQRATRSRPRFFIGVDDWRCSRRRTYCRLCWEN